MVLIRHIMTEPVVMIPASATLFDAASVLCEAGISGAPVVDPSGQLIGFIAETALIDLLFDADARSTLVSQRMTKDLHVVNASDSLSIAARLLALYNVRRLPVVENGRLVGIVTRRELIDYSLRTGELLTEPLVELIPWLAPMT